MFRRRLVWSALVFAFALVASAQQSMPFKLVDGAVLSGRAISGKDEFVQVALDAGGYTNLSWIRLSQETLVILATNRMTAPFASAFVDPPRSGRSTARAKKSITLQPPPRLERTGAGLFASPVMIVLFMILYAANIYAAFEIAAFRQQPTGLVIGAAAILPILGPAIFLAMPTRRAPEEHVVYEEVPAEAADDAPAVAEEAPAPEAEPEKPSTPQQVVFSRGQFTFNRRFFETKFAGFLKMVPGDAERDKVIYIKSARGEYTGPRFTKIEPNEVYLQVRKGNATEDVLIPFSEIYEVVIKHKDA
jgi:hypothetical protein